MISSYQGADEAGMAMDEGDEVRAAIARLRRGDIGGLEALMLRYQVRALRTAALITRDYALAEDLVQAAFLRAYERIGQLDEARPFGPWFLRSVTNDARKAAARGRRRQPLPGLPGDPVGDPPDRGPGPTELVERAETEEALWAALGRLTPTQRAAVVQRYYLGLTEAEMAAAAARPPGTIKWRLHAAREHLRHLLRPHRVPQSSGDPPT